MIKSNKQLFHDFVIALRQENYIVILDYTEPYIFARVTGKGIIGGFCEKNDNECYQAINGRFSFDNEKKFDKWASCPYSKAIPKTDKQIQYILKKLRELSKEKR